MKNWAYSLLLHFAAAAFIWIVLTQSQLAQQYLQGGQSGDVALEWGRASHPSARTTRNKAPAVASDEIALHPTQATHEATTPTAGGGTPGQGSGTGSGTGTGAAQSGAIENYLSSIRSKIEGQLEYPLSLRRRGVVGTTQLNLVIHSTDGSLTQVTMAESSGSAELDQLALAAAQRAAPFPPPPPLSNETPSDKNFELRLPIEFRVNR